QERRLPLRQNFRAWQRVGDSAVNVQVLSLRLDLASLYGLRSEDQTEIFAGAGRDSRSCLPHRGRNGAPPLGAAGGQAKANQLLRREVQLTLQHRGDAHSRKGRT